MKKILITCCIVAASSTWVFAQSSEVSKTDFNTRVTQLNTLLDQGKADEAKTAWGELNKLMTAEMTALKHRISDAVTNNNDKEKNRLTGIAKQQEESYMNAARVQNDPVQNKAVISKNLGEFAATLQ